MKLPRTRGGWMALFWLTLRRCPIDHTALCADPWAFGKEPVLYCLRCEGWTVWPRGMLRALGLL